MLARALCGTGQCIQGHYQLPQTGQTGSDYDPYPDSHRKLHSILCRIRAQIDANDCQGHSQDTHCH